MSTHQTPGFLTRKLAQAALTAVVWGTITGALADQTDLQAALDNKENTGVAAALIAAHEAAGDPHPQYLTAVGIPANNQVGVWTDVNTIEGTAGLTYNGAAFAITGTLSVSSAALGTTTTNGAVYVVGSIGTDDNYWMGGEQINKVNAGEWSFVHRNVGNIAFYVNNASIIPFVIENGAATDNLRVTAAGISTAGNLTVSGTGPHAIGVPIQTYAQLGFGGTFVHSGGFPRGFELSTILNPDAGQTGHGFIAFPTINKAATGTHSEFVTMSLYAPMIGAGASTLTNATTLLINDAPTEGTNNRALWVKDGTVQIGNTFTNPAGRFLFDPTYTVTGSATWGAGMAALFYATMTAEAGFETSVVAFGGVINKAATGTHNLFSTVRLSKPTIGAGASTVTNAASLYIQNAPTEASVGNYALWVAAGAVRLDSNTIINGTLSTTGALSAASLTLTNDLAVAHGGTGASTAAAARTNLSAGLALNLSATGVFNPADATAYYIGDFVTINVVGYNRTYIPRTGTVKRIYISIANSGVVGSGETSTISFRLNDTTDTTISSAITTNAANQYFSNTVLNIAVTANHFFEIKWVTPNWVTNPTALHFSVVVYIE